MFHQQRGLTGEQVLATTFDWVVPGTGRHGVSASHDTHDGAATPITTHVEAPMSAPPTARSLNFESEPSSPGTDHLASPVSKIELPAGKPSAANDGQNPLEMQNDLLLKSVSLSNPPSTPPSSTRAVAGGLKSPSLPGGRMMAPAAAPQTAPPFRRGVGNTAPRMSIHLAAREGWLEVMARMLKDNPTAINEREMLTCQTPLHAAAASCPVAVQFLLSWRPASHPPSRDDSAAIADVAAVGDDRLAGSGQSFAPGGDREKGREEVADFEARNMFGETPLHIASKSGQPEAARLLLQAGSAVNAQATNGMTPLHIAVWAAARAATEKAAELNASSARGADVAGDVAVVHCDTATAAVLLGFDADPTMTDAAGDTPLTLLMKHNGTSVTTAAPAAAGDGGGGDGVGALGSAGGGGGRVGQKVGSSSSSNSSSNMKKRRVAAVSFSNMQLLLRQHMEMHTRLNALRAIDTSRAVMEALEHELRQLVGLEGLKQQLRRWGKGLLLDQRRRALGLPVAQRRAPHMAFLGSPGTGKTTVARVLARLLAMVGVLPCAKVVEVQRTDLVGEFVGHTGPKTRKKIEEAEGGILFVDEAYRLMPAHQSQEKDYGVEALEEIMAVMDSGRVVVVFAGYAGPMQRVFSANEGFRRRVTKYFTFDDLTPRDIARVMILKLQQPRSTEHHHGATDVHSEDSSIDGLSDGGSSSSGGECECIDAEENNGGPESWATPSPLTGFRLHPSCTEDALAATVQQRTTEKQRRERNGGMALPVLLDARDVLDLRLDLDCCDKDELMTLRLEDIETALDMVPP